MIACISKFEIENGMEAAVKEAFKNRPRLVDNFPGFIRLKVLSPFDNPSEIHLITIWENEIAFDMWHRNHLKDSHQLIPKGLKLVPKSWTLTKYEYVSD